MNIASLIDHTLLKPTTTSGDVLRVCNEAEQFGFAAVCIPPCYVSEAKLLLANSPVKVATVIGFPLGYHTTGSKLCEIEEAVEREADELDMVINLAAVKNGYWDSIREEVAACVRLIQSKGKVMKLIVESGLLTDEELLKTCDLVTDLKVDFIKTSTGFAERGATLHAVEIMRKHVPDSIQIKASGGIRTFSFAKELVAAGASRLGCSASVQIVNEQNLLT